MVQAGEEDDPVPDPLPVYLWLSCYCPFNDLVDVVQADGEEDLGPDPLPVYLRLSYYCAFNDLVDVVQAGGEEILDQILSPSIYDSHTTVPLMILLMWCRQVEKKILD